MGKYADLTGEQKAAIANTAMLVRGALLSARNFIGLAKFAALDSDTNTGALIAALDAGEAIPNASGLAGSDDVLATDVASQIATMQGLIATWDTSEMQQLHAKFVGAVNIYGQR